MVLSLSLSVALLGISSGPYQPLADPAEFTIQLSLVAISSITKTVQAEIPLEEYDKC